MLSSVLHHVGASGGQLLRMRFQALHDPSLSGFHPRTELLHIVGAGLPSWTTSTAVPFALPGAAGCIGRSCRLFLARRRGRIRCGFRRFMQPGQTDRDTAPERQRGRLSQMLPRSQHTILLHCRCSHHSYRSRGHKRRCFQTRSIQRGERQTVDDSRQPLRPAQPHCTLAESE